MWIVFRPDRDSDDALVRFGIRYGQSITDVRNAQEHVESKYAIIEAKEPGGETKEAYQFFDALEFLHRRICTAVEAIRNDKFSDKRRNVGIGESIKDLKKRAEKYVRRSGWPGLRSLASNLGCPASSLSNAVSKSAYLMARKAEHKDAMGRKARVVQLTDVVLDSTPSGGIPCRNLLRNRNATTKPRNEGRIAFVRERSHVEYLTFFPRKPLFT